MTGAIEQFRQALAGRGIIPPPDLLGDGKLRRCDAEGRNGKDDAAYVLHLDGLPAGGFENHRDGKGWETWRADIRRQPTQAEEKQNRERVEAAKLARAAEDARRRSEAATKASTILQGAAPASADHAYPKRKGVGAHGLRQTDDGRLIVPISDGENLLSLQFIGANGEKRFLPGGQVAGGYYMIGEPQGTICIAEGFATGASIHEATGHAVAVAFNATNLLPVAKALREKYPDLRLIICADNDYLTEGNPGMTKAAEAARAIGAAVAVPDFGDDRPEGTTDFNDLHQAQGSAAVQRCIDGVPPDPTGETDALGAEESLSETVIRLAALSPLEYDRIREAEAKRLKVRASTLDKEVSGYRRTKAEDGGKAAMFPTVESWPDPVNGAVLLHEICATVRRFIICKGETAIAATLWCAFTWFVDHVQVAPLAVITAPEKRCGKSQLLNLIGELSRRPLVASNISPSATFRVIEAHAPTLLIDEADTFFRENEELRGVINSGHTRQSAYVIRNVGDDHEPRQFSTWGAKAISGIGSLADTLMDRAIVLELRRKLGTETVERLRHADKGLFRRLASMLMRFADDSGLAVERARPDLPDALNDRAQDNWEPLLAIADRAGGDWPGIARATALALSGENQEPVSLAAELLADIKEVFETKRVDRISTADLLEALTADDLKPWAAFNRGKPISPRQLAKRLAEYSIKPQSIRIGTQTPKGFMRAWFDDAFTRYLVNSPDTPSQSATSATRHEHIIVPMASAVSDYPQRGGNETLSATQKPASIAACGAVADKRPILGVVEVDV